ncbi:uncharacterized protein LAJ45_02348 [Morchella importuna]|uniref:uncharacterized protein n=1 Tax=Morchella importuna TaxID=1174673 RepID=UPI001E8D1EF8|nr:uncharacterized protein LAJ45_02348 [Morchella importuna]KAH8153535.1 hypothetical protein LAJ45_02348 [Morchella importuna]
MFHWGGGGRGQPGTCGQGRSVDCSWRFIFDDERKEGKLLELVEISNLYRIVQIQPAEEGGDGVASRLTVVSTVHLRKVARHLTDPQVNREKRTRSILARQTRSRQRHEQTVASDRETILRTRLV